MTKQDVIKFVSKHGLGEGSKRTTEKSYRRFYLVVYLAYVINISDDEISKILGLKEVSVRHAKTRFNDMYNYDIFLTFCQNELEEFPMSIDGAIHFLKRRVSTIDYDINPNKICIACVVKDELASKYIELKRIKKTNDSETVNFLIDFYNKHRLNNIRLA